MRAILAVLVALLLLAGGWTAGRRWAPPGPAGAKLPPFACHEAFWRPVNPNIQVTLKDQFTGDDGMQVTVGVGRMLCTPVTKKELPEGRKPVPVNKGDHLYCYVVEYLSKPTPWQWFLTDQFGRNSVKVEEGWYLCEPSDKVPLPPDQPTATTPRPST